MQQVANEGQGPRSRGQPCLGAPSSSSEKQQQAGKAESQEENCGCTCFHGWNPVALARRRLRLSQQAKVPPPVPAFMPWIQGPRGRRVPPGRTRSLRAAPKAGWALEIGWLLISDSPISCLHNTFSLGQKPLPGDLHPTWSLGESPGREGRTLLDISQWPGLRVASEDGWPSLQMV